MVDIPTLFTRLGRCAAWANDLYNQQYTLLLGPGGEATNLQSAYLDRLDLVQGVQAQVIQQASTMGAWITSVPITVANATLADLQQDLNSPSSGTATILLLLYNYMIENSQSIQETIINAPQITPNAANNGNGVLVAAMLNNLGTPDQRIINEQVQFTCTSSQWSGGTAGAEQFNISGYPASNPTQWTEFPGNGNGSIVVADSRSSQWMNNGNFASWSGTPLTPPNIPSGWTVVGSSTTNVLQNGSQQHNGVYCAQFSGDGATATISLSQVVAPRILSSTIYCAGIWLKRGTGTITPGSTLTVNITGTGAATQTLVTIDPASLSSVNYELFYVFFATAPTVPPSNYSFNITWSNASTAGAAAVVYIDNAVLVTPTNFGHVQYCLFRGSADFASARVGNPIGDQFDVTTSIYSSGVFAEFFSQFFNFQLPSSASPTISDALAS